MIYVLLGCQIIIKNNIIHCKINDICIVWMLNHYKNNAIHNKINDICIAWMPNHYQKQHYSL